MAETPSPNPVPRPNFLQLLKDRQRERDAELEAQEHRRQTLERMMVLLQQGKIESGSAFDVQVEPATADDVQELFERRAQLNIAHLFVEAARAKHAGNPAPLRALIAKAAKQGGLLELEGYAPEDILAKVCSPSYIISHARGAIFDPTTGNLRPSVWAADAQIELPADDVTEPLTFVPDQSSKDVFFPQQRDLAERVAADILAHPGSAAVLQDVSVAPFQPDVPLQARYPATDYRNKKFASVVTNHALKRIENEINPLRRVPIRYLIANMFRVPSVTLAEGPEVIFNEPVTNEISVLVHSLGSEYRRCFLGWESPVTKIKAPDGSIINAGWLSAVRILGRHAA